MVKLLPHNQSQYDNAIQALNEGKIDILITQDTGTGKGYVAMALCQTAFKDKEILYIAPRKSLFGQFLGYGNGTEHITCVTYNQADSEEAILEMLYDYDAYIVDEAHHLGSDVYGKNLLDLKKRCVEAEKPFIGLTATPVRDSDGVDISDNFSTVLDGYTLFDCIQDGLVKPFDYIVCSSDMVEQLNALPGDGTTVDGKVLKIDFESSEDLLRDIVAHNHRNKWLVFFASIKDLNDHMSLVQSLFPDYPIKVIHSESDEEFDHDELNSLDKWVVVSVDMLVEGIHLDGSEGGISFRNVHSLRVFRQMMGRLTAIGSSNYPLMIDCTESAYRMLGKLEDEQKIRQEGAGKSSGKITDIFNVTLDNRRYFDLMKLYEKAEAFTFHDKEYRHLAEVAEDYIWDYTDFLSWKNRQDWRSMTKTQICEGYEDFFATWVIHFNGKEYRSYDDICTDMSWAPKKFEKWRNRSKKAVGKTRTEIVEEYYNSPWNYMFYFHNHPYPLFGGYELVCKDMGWNREDFYAFVGRNLESLANEDFTNRSLFDMYESHLSSVIIIDGRIFETDFMPPHTPAEVKALQYIGATKQEFIDWRRSILQKEDRDSMTLNEQYQVFARYYMHKNTQQTEYQSQVDELTSGEYTKLNVQDAGGRELSSLTIPSDMINVVTETHRLFMNSMGYEQQKKKAKDKEKEEPVVKDDTDHVIFYTLECLAPQGRIEQFEKGEADKPLDPGCLNQFANMVQTSDATTVLCGEYRKLFHVEASKKISPVTQSGFAVMEQLQDAGISLTQMTPDIKTLRYYARASSSPRSAEIKDWLQKHQVTEGVTRYSIILDTVRHTDYVMEMKRIAVNGDTGLSEKNVDDGLVKLNVIKKRQVRNKYDGVVFLDLAGTLAPTGWEGQTESAPAMDDKLSMLREITGSTNACVVLIGEIRAHFKKDAEPADAMGRALKDQCYRAGVDIIDLAPDFDDPTYGMNPHIKGRLCSEARMWCARNGYVQRYVILRGDGVERQDLEDRNFGLDPKVGLSEKAVEWCQHMLTQKNPFPGKAGGVRKK